MGEVQGEKAHLPYFFARLFRAMPQLTERLEEANLCLVTHVHLACERRRISGCHWFRGDKRQPEIRLRSQANVRHVSIIFQFRPKSYNIFKDILLCFAFSKERESSELPVFNYFRDFFLLLLKI